jgi:hypothetical protein
MDCVGLVVPTDSLGKVMPVAESVAFGPELTPTPFKERECGLPAVLSAMVIEARRGPIKPGVNVTLIVQFVPGVRLEQEVLLLLKSVALVPAIATLLITRSRLPVLVSVSECVALVVPTSCALKSRPEGVRVRLSGSSRIETV